MQNPNGNQSTTPQTGSTSSTDNIPCANSLWIGISIGVAFSIAISIVIYVALTYGKIGAIITTVIMSLIVVLIISFIKLFPFLGIKELYSISKSDNNNNNLTGLQKRINEKEKTSERVLVVAKALISWGVIVSLVLIIIFLCHYGFYAEKTQDQITPLALKFSNNIDSLSQSSIILTLDTTQLKTLQEVIKDNGDKNAIDYASSFGDFMAGTVLGLWSLGGLLFVYVSFLGQQIDSLRTKSNFNWQVVDTKINSCINKLQNIQFFVEEKLVPNSAFFPNIVSLSKKFEEPVPEFAATPNKNHAKTIMSYATMHHNLQLSEEEKQKKLITILKAGYHYCYGDNHQNITHYVKYVCFIIDFIEKSDIENEAKEHFFIDLLASIQGEELVIWYFYGLEFPDFKNYIEKYSLLKNFNWDTFFSVFGNEGVELASIVGNNKLLGDIKIFETLYSSSAFGKSD
jgi:hypothetical protein